MAAVTIFLGAFLVFLVQPLVGNTLLPVFGGTATIWTCCLASFQTLLVVGYYYAHVTGSENGHTKSRWVRKLHPLLLITIGVVLWGAICKSEKSVLSLLFSAGCCYVVLSANSTLVQVLAGGRYRLYAVSNAGSLCGLLAYPFLFEPYLTLPEQWRVFAAAVIAYGVLFWVLELRYGRAMKESHAPNAGGLDGVECSVTSIRGASSIAYFALSFASCYLLNAVSTHLGSDITPLPMLWVAILGAYLVSYILAFNDSISRYVPWLGLLTLPLSAFAAYHFGLEGYSRFIPELIIGLLLTFFGGLLFHARLYRIRPGAGGLTRFYLIIAVGGAIGGAVCAFAMPMVSDIVAEYPIALAMIAAVIWCDFRDGVAKLVNWERCRECYATTTDKDLRKMIDFFRTMSAGPAFAFRGWRMAPLVILVVFAVYGVLRGNLANGLVLKRYRNFYGTGYVSRSIVPLDNGGSYEVNEFRCNGTVHGFQQLRGEWKRQVGTVYYAEHAGGLPILKHPKRIKGQPLRVALCGMGIGTLATYGAPGDLFRFYEINPDVVAIAENTNLFSFVSGSSAKVEIVLDDARQALEKERVLNEDKFDVIIVDVFNGDSIPPHMATKEAFQLFLDRLAPNGILSFHLSNWHLDLMPLVKAAAKELELDYAAYICRPNIVSYMSKWAFFAKGRLPDLYDVEAHEKIDFNAVKDIPLMTDDFHSLVPYIKLNTSPERNN